MGRCSWSDPTVLQAGAGAVDKTSAKLFAYTKDARLMPAPLAIFAGPSLPPEDRVERPGVVYLPPASRGDVESAAEQYGAVLLIDGVFHHDLAPSPKEVYAACRRVATLGASSMGALRAAECWPYGMRPLGVIARWYMREVIDGDDEVAVLVHPEKQRAITVPSVNVRYVAWLSRKRGLLSPHDADAWIEAARNIYYMDRQWSSVLDLLPIESRFGVAEIAGRQGDLKRLDARLALRTTLRLLDAGHLRAPFERVAAA